MYCHIFLLDWSNASVYSLYKGQVPKKKSGTCQNAMVDCSAEQCLAINNIDLVMSFMNPFISDLGIDSVLNKLEQQNGGRKNRVV